MAPPNTKHFEATIQLDSGLVIPTSALSGTAALGAMLVSDASGNLSYQTSGAIRKFTREPELAAAAVVSNVNQASLEGLPTIDGVTMEAEQIVLLTKQTEEKNNGPWLVAAGAWTRPADYATGWEIKNGRNIMIMKGTKGAQTVWMLDYKEPIVIGTTAQKWLVLPQLGSKPQEFEWKELFGAERELHPYKNCMVHFTVYEKTTERGGFEVFLVGPEEKLIGMSMKLAANDKVTMGSIIVPAGRKYKVNMATTPFEKTMALEYV